MAPFCCPELTISGPFWHRFPPVFRVAAVDPSCPFRVLSGPGIRVFENE
jgi:hypothetical protein